MINSEVWFKFYIEGQLYIPDGLGVRIPDSHSGGPGSIPGAGGLFDFSTLFRDVKPGILVAIFTNTFAKGPKVGNLEKNEESTWF